MRVNASLRHRLIVACVMLALVVGTVFAAAAYVINEAVEHQLIRTRLDLASRALIDDSRAGLPLPRSLDLKYAIGEHIPEPLRDLALGFHEVVLNGHTLAVLLSEHGNVRYAIIDNVTDFERLEGFAFAGLAVAFIGGVLLALVIARASAARIIAPLIALRRAVDEDEIAAQRHLMTAPDEIGVLARAFQARTSALADALWREQHFTADVSHELRTPLTVILGAAELLSTRLSSDPALQDIAERIQRTSAELSVRVSALLQLARTPEGAASGALNLRNLLQKEIEYCRPLLSGKPVELIVDAPTDVWVFASGDLAAVAISNLLRNACHYTQSGVIRIRLRSHEFVIEDTGPGVPEGVRTRLFNPSPQGNEATLNGLGLSIVKRIADHLGWRVHLDDAPGGGSRFTLAFHPTR